MFGREPWNFLLRRFPTPSAAELCPTLQAPSALQLSGNSEASAWRRLCPLSPAGPLPGPSA